MKSQVEIQNPAVALAIPGGPIGTGANLNPEIPAAHRDRGEIPTRNIRNPDPGRRRPGPNLNPRDRENPGHFPGRIGPGAGRGGIRGIRGLIGTVSDRVSLRLASRSSCPDMIFLFFWTRRALVLVVQGVKIRSGGSALNGTRPGHPRMPTLGAGAATSWQCPDLSGS